MTILIANIGTSDLAVKIDEYYLPIGFDRNEPNLDKAKKELNDDEKAIWEQELRQSYIASVLCKELGVNVNPKNNRFSFRELTSRILEEYRQDPNSWHPRLSPGRLWGVINAAIEQEVKTVFIFVTDQPEFDPPELEGETPQKNSGYATDSIHLFDILQRWVSREFKDSLKFNPVIIPKQIPAIDQDGLLNEYYKFFNTQNQFDKSTKILVSVKGGTQQMQTALRVQAISSDITTQIYLEPKLSIKKLLAGQPSECQKNSYWRYQRTQKYQTVKQLLNRWDFDGALTILQQWENTLTTLKDEKIEGAKNIEDSQNRIQSIIYALSMAVGYLNLDKTYAESQASSLAELADLTTTYNHLLNLYTQCCLFWEVDRIADFLTRMGSFYEETLHELIRALGGIKYFDRNTYPDDWWLMTDFLLRDNNNLAQAFYQLESQLEGSKLIYRINKKNCLTKGVWVRSAGGFKLPGRFTKRNFVEALLQLDNRNQTLGQIILTAMTTLDYWMAKRNQLIHGAKGVSKLRMQEALEEDKRLNQAGQMDNNDISNTVDHACDAKQILTQMANIARSTLTFMEKTQPPSVRVSNPADYFDPGKELYYIYSDIRKWVIETLNSDV